MGTRIRYFIAFVFIPAAALIAVYFFLLPAFAGQVAIPSLIAFGPFSLRIYSLAMLTGVLAAFFVARKFAPKFSLPEAELENLVIVSVLAGLLGARLHHVFSEWSFYAIRPELIWQFWRGGLGYFGGLLGAVLAIAVYCRMRNLDFWKICDALAVAAPLGQALGRWGNFFNQEAYGLPTTLPWKMFVAPERRLPAYFSFEYFHPAFLYESLFSIVIFLILLYLLRTASLSKGGLFASYVILYSMVRFFLDPLRADEHLVFGLPSNQLLAMAFMAAAAGALVFSSKRGAGKSEEN